MWQSQDFKKKEKKMYIKLYIKKIIVFHIKTNSLSYTWLYILKKKCESILVKWTNTLIFTLQKLATDAMILYIYIYIKKWPFFLPDYYKYIFCFYQSIKWGPISAWTVTVSLDLFITFSHIIVSCNISSYSYGAKPLVVLRE